MHDYGLFKKVEKGFAHETYSSYGVYLNLDCFLIAWSEERNNLQPAHPWWEIL
jgi:hypothetical protein